MKNNSSQKKRMIEMVFIAVKTYLTTPTFTFYTILSCDMKEKYLVYVIHVRFTKHPRLYTIDKSTFTHLKRT